MCTACGGGSQTTYTFGDFTCVASVGEAFDAGYEDCGFADQDDASYQFVSDPDLIYYVYVMTQGADSSFDLEFTCATVVEGCMNDLACNYDATANVDSDCDFASCACTDSSAGTGLQLEVVDSFGDGFNGASYTVTDGSGSVVASGDLDDTMLYSEDNDNWVGIEFGIEAMCLGDGCYTINVGGGDDDSEISWTFSSASGVVASGDGGDTASFTIGDYVCGCTDDDSCNYNDLATADDGSCEYESCAGCTDSSYCNYDVTATLDDGSCCDQNCVTIEMTDSYGDGWTDFAGDSFSYQISTIDGVEVASGTLADGSSGFDLYCLADGCYFFEIIGDAADGTEVGWSITGAAGEVPSGGVDDSDIFSVGGYNCIEGCLAACACNYNEDANVENNSLCVFEGCDGCTYDTATNYDDTAVNDNGTCEFALQNPCPADLNGDGSVTTVDLLEFLTAFGDECE